MAKKFKKSLKAQADISRGEAQRLFDYTQTWGANQEAVRGALWQGLGSAQQLSGQYAPAAGQAPRDYSRYSQGLIVTNRYIGDMAASIAEMRASGASPEAWRMRRGGDEARYRTDAQMEALIAQRQAQFAGDIAGGGKKAKKAMKKVYKGTPWRVGKTGELEQRKGAARVGEAAEAGKPWAVDDLRNWELANQVADVQALYNQMHQAAQAGDFDAADQFLAQAEELTQQYGLNEQFDPTGLQGDAAGAQFRTGQVYGAVGDPLAQAEGALGSEGGMVVGQLLHRARQLQDPTSPEAQQFMSSLTQGALDTVEASRVNALRAMGSAEREGTRALRDQALASGQATATVRNASLAARTSERFATLKAGLETDTAAKRSQIISQAGQFYQQFSVDLAKNAVGLASAWVNDQSGVRDSFRAMQMNLSSNYIQNLMGFAGTSQTNLTQYLTSQMATESGESGGWASAIGGAISGGTAGAALGPWGAVAGAVVGGVGGYLG